MIEKKYKQDTKEVSDEVHTKKRRVATKSNKSDMPQYKPYRNNFFFK